MALVDGIVAIFAIGAVLVVIGIKMKGTPRGRTLLEWLDGFSPTNLFAEEKGVTKEVSMQTWSQQRELL